jgi:peptidyl-prolyl cis-trans isomerase SurA
MKKIYLLLLLILGASTLFAQTLFSYGINTVSKDEFLRAYNKNKTPITDKEKSLREYLDLYSKFKLKVKVAEEMKLDTLQQMQADIQNFRSQVEDTYMNDDEGLNSLIDEAFSRKQKDIHLLHFYVQVNDKTSPEDSASAYKAIEAAYAALKQATGNDDDLAKNITSNYPPVKGGDIGYITAFSVPYEYENIAYSLKPGEVSTPYRSKNAWHIFKDIDERKDVGKWKIRQILFAIPPNVSQETIKAIGQKADSMYNRLLEGDDFSTLAKKYSEDKITYQNGGEMPEFGTGKYSSQFEHNVFELKNDSDISKPFLTSYGFHIVKRLHQSPTPTEKTDDTYLNSLKQQVLQDSRINSVKGKFLKDVLVKIDYKKNPAVKDADIFRYADSVIRNKKTGVYPINNLIVFSFAKEKVKGSDWLNYVNDYAKTSSATLIADKTLFDKYVGIAALEYYRKHLEEYNADFKYQMQEFREGNMLFEIMERNVWTKAANDSAGLQNYYNQHKEKYLWAESADVFMFNCTDKKAAEEAVDALKSGKDWKKISEDSQGRIQSDSGRYEISQLQVPDGTKITEGLVSEPLVSNTDNTASVIKVLKIFPANEQRNFDEAKGLVINDYQNFLEEKWIAELKKKYPIKVNEAVFQSLLK